MYKATLFRKRRYGNHNHPYKNKYLAQIQPKENRKTYKHKIVYIAILVFPQNYNLFRPAAENDYRGVL